MPNSQKHTLSENKRIKSERRKYSVKGLVWSLFKGRRKGPQRIAEKNDSYIVDVLESSTLWFVASIMALSAADALFTLSILALGGQEVNPVMNLALSFGPSVFFGIKLFLTGLGLLICMMHIKFKVFRRFRMEVIIYGLFFGYSVLIAYEIYLICWLIEV